MVGPPPFQNVGSAMALPMVQRQDLLASDETLPCATPMLTSKAKGADFALIAFRCSACGIVSFRQVALLSHEQSLEGRSFLNLSNERLQDKLDGQLYSNESHCGAAQFHSLTNSQDGFLVQPHLTEFTGFV